MNKGIAFDWVGTLYKRDRGLFSDSERVLCELKQRGYRLGLVSLAKGGVEKRNQELESSGLKPLLDVVIIEETKGTEQYLRCMEALGTTSQTTTVVDDRTIRGIQIGNQLGCQTIWIQTGEYAHEAPTLQTGEPTHRIDSLEQLLDILV